MSFICTEFIVLFSKFFSTFCTHFSAFYTLSTSLNFLIFSTALLLKFSASFFCVSSSALSWRSWIFYVSCSTSLVFINRCTISSFTMFYYLISVTFPTTSFIVLLVSTISIYLFFSLGYSFSHAFIAITASATYFLLSSFLLLSLIWHRFAKIPVPLPLNIFFFIIADHIPCAPSCCCRWNRHHSLNCCCCS